MDNLLLAIVREAGRAVPCLAFVYMIAEIHEAFAFQ